METLNKYKRRQENKKQESEEHRRDIENDLNTKTQNDWLCSTWDLASLPSAMGCESAARAARRTTHPARSTVRPSGHSLGLSDTLGTPNAGPSHSTKRQPATQASRPRQVTWAARVPREPPGAPRTPHDGLTDAPSTLWVPVGLSVILGIPSAGLRPFRQASTDDQSVATSPSAIGCESAARAARRTTHPARRNIRRCESAGRATKRTTRPARRTVRGDRRPVGLSVTLGIPNAGQGPGGQASTRDPSVATKPSAANCESAARATKRATHPARRLFSRCGHRVGRKITLGTRNASWRPCRQASAGDPSVETKPSVIGCESAARAARRTTRPARRAFRGEGLSGVTGTLWDFLSLLASRTLAKGQVAKRQPATQASRPSPMS